MFAVLFSILLMGCAGSVAPSDKKANAQLLSADSSSFYYYVSGERVPLTLSLEWIAVKFAGDDPAAQSAALKGSIADSLDKAKTIPQLGLALLPVQDGVTFETLVGGINALRTNTAEFSQVNPVFQAGNTGMVVTDEFIATFAPEKSMEEIEAINSAHGVEVVDTILGQENTFVLRVTAGAGMDTLSLANLYQESGLAVYAAPNFVRVQ